MLRITGTTIVVVLALLTAAPRVALAWSEHSEMGDQYGGRAFTDPDDRVERMTGRSDDGERKRTANFGSQGDGGWSFSMTQRQSSSQTSPLGLMFPPAWQDRSR